MDRVPGRPPYESYAAIAAAFGAALAGGAALARALGRRPEELTWLDLATLSAATFKVSRTIARDRVASFIREPFVEGDAVAGDERPAPEGTRRAIGELVTCTRCVGTWVAAGLGTAQVVTPRFGRLLTWTLSAAAANDFLQAAFVALTKKADELEERASYG